jgi:hypothetical protein
MARPTRSGGILGRRRPAAQTSDDGTKLLARQLAGPNPVLRQLAAEAQTLVSGARKAKEEPTLARCGNRVLKTRRNAGVLGAQKSGAPSTKKHPHCRYCGAASAYPWGAPQICPRCERLRDRHEPQTTIQAIADKMRANPALPWSQTRASDTRIGDDRVYLKVHRTLANREDGAAAERLAKHGPGRLEREGPTVKVSEAVDKAKRVARAQFRRVNEQFEEAAE